MNQHNTERPRGRPWAVFFVVLLPILWGPTFVIVKVAIRDVSPALFNVLRFGLASLLFLCFKPGRKAWKLLFKHPSPEEKQTFKDILILGLTLGGGYILQAVGLMTTTSSKSAFITSTAVIWTLIISFFIGREKFSAKLITAVLMTILGLILLTHPLKEHDGLMIGDIMTFGCAVCFGIYIIRIDKALTNAERITHDAASAGLLVTSGQLGVSSILMIGMACFETPQLTINHSTLAALAYTGIVTTAVTSYLQVRYQNAVTPSVAAIIYMLEPVVAAFFGYFVLYEHLGTEELVGALLIVVGVVIAQVKLPGRLRAKEATLG